MFIFCGFAGSASIRGKPARASVALYLGTPAGRLQCLLRWGRLWCSLSTCPHGRRGIWWVGAGTGSSWGSPPSLARGNSTFIESFKNVISVVLSDGTEYPNRNQILERPQPSLFQGPLPNILQWWKPVWFHFLIKITFTKLTSYISIYKPFPSKACYSWNSIFLHPPEKCDVANSTWERIDLLWERCYFSRRMGIRDMKSPSSGDQNSLRCQLHGNREIWAQHAPA